MGIFDFIRDRVKNLEKSSRQAGFEYFTVLGTRLDQEANIPDEAQIKNGKTDKNLISHLITRENLRNRDNLRRLNENKAILTWIRGDAKTEEDVNDPETRYSVSVLSDIIKGEHEIMTADTFKQIEDKTVIIDRGIIAVNPQDELYFSSKGKRSGDALKQMSGAKP